MDRVSLGERLRQLRKEKGWTLAEVAARSGLAVSTVSKVERGRMSLAYDKFIQLASGLGADVGELFAPTGQSLGAAMFSVTRAEETDHHETDNYVYKMLSSDLRSKHMTPMLGRIKAHDIRAFSDFVRHTGEEFLLVLDGSLDVHLEGQEPLRLNRHDSIYFDSATGHAYVSAGDEDTIIVVVCWQPDAGPALAGGT